MVLKPEIYWPVGAVLNINAFAAVVVIGDAIFVVVVVDNIVIVIDSVAVVVVAVVVDVVVVVVFDVVAATPHLLILDLSCHPFGSICAYLCCAGHSDDDETPPQSDKREKALSQLQLLLLWLPLIFLVGRGSPEVRLFREQQIFRSD